MAPSSRSLALRSGFWQLQSMSRRIRHTWLGSYCTPKLARITSRTRASVQRSVAKPCLRGPCSSNRPKRSRCLPLSLGLRPGCFWAARPSWPLCSYACRHRVTEARDVPTSRATLTACTPSSNKAIACLRRCSNSAADPLGRIEKSLSLITKRFLGTTGAVTLAIQAAIGEENFVAVLVWDRNRKNDAKLFSVGHEYMVVYALRPPGYESPGASRKYLRYSNLRCRNGFITRCLLPYSASLPC